MPFNLRTPLEVRQDGFRSLQLRASFGSEPLAVPLYWAVRATRSHGDRSWSIEVMHHKLFLRDPPGEIQSFGISHGFNLVTVQHAWLRSPWEPRLGLGAVLAHPENEVRGRRLDQGRGLLGRGYYLAGTAATAACSRRFRIRGPLALVLEARGSLAPVSVPVADGDARLTNVALHLLAGIASFP